MSDPADRKSDQGDSILIYPKPWHSIGRGDRQALIHSLTERLAGRVEAAYVFGSFLTDDFDEQSDLDLLLIKETDLSFFRRIEEFLDLAHIPMVLDIIIYTPGEFESVKREGRAFPGFKRSMLESATKIL